MVNQLNDLQKTADNAVKQLADNQEWIKRYAGYATKIRLKEDVIKNAEKKIRVPEPLFLYSCISQAANGTQGHVILDLRYKGQSVANIDYKKGTLKLETNQNTGKFYGIEGGETLDWDDAKRKQFCSEFAGYPMRNPVPKKGVKGKNNEEHRYESALLTELSKKTGRDKAVKNIQPVTLGKKVRFQMPTPFSASKGTPVYANSNGGGIDLLCRTRHGNKTTLNVFELKDEYEDPINVLRQAIIYAVFIHQLLTTRNAGREEWWSIFLNNGKIPDADAVLNINVVAALPDNKNAKTGFAGDKILLGKDTLTLHYFYFNLEGEKDNIKDVKTSFFPDK